MGDTWIITIITDPLCKERITFKVVLENFVSNNEDVNWKQIRKRKLNLWPDLWDALCDIILYMNMLGGIYLVGYADNEAAAITTREL